MEEEAEEEVVPAPKKRGRKPKAVVDVLVPRGS
jgi:hypothetical protein